MQSSATPTSGFSAAVPATAAQPARGGAFGERVRTELTVPGLATALTFALLFAKPFGLLVHDWWTRPEAGHGLLLAPIALWLAWRSGVREGAAPSRRLGLAFIAVAVFLRCASELAAELFTMRGSIVLALIGLTVYAYGVRQVLHWWLPFALVGLSIPLPELVTQSLALPLQFKASRMGAALLEMRRVPVLLNGNVIRLPGQELFVTEACSGLRSLTALLSMALLLGGMVLRAPIARALLLLAAIPIAIAINGVRVFLTGFLVFFVSPEFGKGFMHITEGWLLFLVSLGCLAIATWIARRIERPILSYRSRHA